MGKRSAEVEKWTQKILEEVEEDIKFSPSRIKNFFIDNIITRTFSHIFAYTDSEKPIRLRATEEGLLKTTSFPVIYERYNTYAGTAKDSYDSTTTHEFSESYSRFDILIENGDAVLSFKLGSGVWGDDIILNEGYHSIDFSHLGFRIKNRTPGKSITYNATTYK